VQLEQQRAKLEATQANLVSPERLRQLAKSLKMSEPEPQQLETLQGGTTASAEARNSLPTAR